MLWQLQLAKCDREKKVNHCEKGLPERSPKDLFHESRSGIEDEVNALLRLLKRQLGCLFLQ
jgi:hypothetical protein